MNSRFTVLVTRTFSACMYCYSGAFTASTNKSCSTLQTALSSLLNETGDGLTIKQHQILQYNANHVQI